jgi:hypothetical protein
VTSYDDPFTVIYKATWEALENHRGFRDLVRPGNRLKLEDGDGPIKQDISSSDLPELVLWPYTIEPMVRANSSSSEFEMTMQPRLAAGDWAPEKLYRVLWELLVALTPWPSAINNATWEGGNMTVTYVRVEACEIGMSDDEAIRGIRGWVSLCTLRVKFWVPLAQMAIEE